jgi:putative transcriptional regulator
MIRCHLSRLMGEKRVRIVDVARSTGISRNMLAKLYYDRAKRVELSDLARLCQYFGCTVGDLLEWIRESAASRSGAKPGTDAPRRRK